MNADRRDRGRRSRRAGGRVRRWATPRGVRRWATPRGRRRTGDERGVAMVWVGLLLVPLMLAAGFVVDGGSWYVRGQVLQNAVDAAALAGVVWLPDMTKASQVARDTLQRNGVSTSATVSVDVSSPTGYRLQVRVTDADPEQYFSQLAVRPPTIVRQAVAEYIPPVPMASPRNHIGLNSMVGGANEGFHLAVNGFCNPRENGDPFSSRFTGTKIYPMPYPCPAPEGPGPGGTAEVNAQFRSTGYTFYVDVPASLASGVDLTAYDIPYYYDGVGPDSWGTGNTTYVRLQAPDSTNFDDTDNPTYAGCSSGWLSGGPRTFNPGDAGPMNYGTVFGSNRWTLLCRIPPGISGRFILTVAAGSMEYADATNTFGLLARKGTTGGSCDSRTDGTCPRISARDDVSIVVDTPSATAELFLAQIDSEHQGETMIVNLFDPGEGGRYLQLLDPNGNPVSFTWATSDGISPSYSGSGSSLDVSTWGTPLPGRLNPYILNDRWVQLRTTLPTDFTSSYGSNRWWRIRYVFGSSVWDRTTWSIQLLGRPVRLLAPG